jgi:hypothetical protein
MQDEAGVARATASRSGRTSDRRSEPVPHVRESRDFWPGADSSSRRSAGAERTTGLQVAQLGLAAQIQAWRGQLTDREYRTLLELHVRHLARELTELAA